MDGYVPPHEEHVEKLIDFVTAWDRSAPIVVHCYAGISRSTAGAFITACALNPKRDETSIARAIRSLSPTAQPNIRLVSLADDLLGRKGRMIDAVSASGRALPPMKASRSGSISTGRAMANGRRRSRSASPPRSSRSPTASRECSSPASGRADEPDGLPFGPSIRAAPHLRNRAARLGRGADGARPRLCRAALHLRRPRPASRAGDTGPHLVSVGYLALTRMPENAGLARGRCRLRALVRVFPWEDWRDGRPDLLDDAILPPSQMGAQKRDGTLGAQRAAAAVLRRRRRRLGRGARARALRASLLGRAGRRARATGAAPGAPAPLGLHALRSSPHRCHRDRAAACQAQIPAGGVRTDAGEFTLTELQRTVEAISGRHLHKQNFRRLVEGAALVEPTGEMSTATGGRPAALFRFRREVMHERPAPGLRLGVRS